MKTKEETIKLCDEEIARMRNDGDQDTPWHWEAIDRWLDIRISLMRKIADSK
jgi:hypothetical protein